MPSWMYCCIHSEQITVISFHANIVLPHNGACKHFSIVLHERCILTYWVKNNILVSMSNMLSAKKKKLACGAHMYSGISVNQNCTANGIAACLVRHMGDRKKWNLIDWKENFRYSVNRSTGKNSKGTFLKWEGIYKCILSWDVFYLLNCFSEF